MENIVVVADSSFGRRLMMLPTVHPMWIVESEMNWPWIRARWDDDKGNIPVSLAVTSFTRLPEEAPETSFVRILETVDEHHELPPWKMIEVYGVTLTEFVKDRLLEYGVSSFDEHEGMFLATR